MKSLIQKLKRNSYLFFFLKLFVLGITIFILDYLIGSTLNHYYFKQVIGRQYRTTYSIDSTKAEVLIFGSSKAVEQYDPTIFESHLNRSTYNVGSPGQNIFYHYAILKTILKRYKPQIIILDLMPWEFIKDKESYDRLAYLLPYYKKHPEIHSIIDLKGYTEKIKLFSQIYPFNSDLLFIVGGNLKKINKDDLDIKGYKPSSNIWQYHIKTIESTKYELDSAKIKVFNNFIIDCLKSKINLYIVCSPVYFLSESTEYSIKRGEEIAQAYNIKFFDYSRDTFFLNKRSLFADIAHLNIDGSTIFLDNLACRINREYKN